MGLFSRKKVTNDEADRKDLSIRNRPNQLGRPTPQASVPPRRLAPQAPLTLVSASTPGGQARLSFPTPGGVMSRPVGNYSPSALDHPSVSDHTSIRKVTAVRENSSVAENSCLRENSSVNNRLQARDHLNGLLSRSVDSSGRGQRPCAASQEVRLTGSQPPPLSNALQSGLGGPQAPPIGDAKSDLGVRSTRNLSPSADLSVKDGSVCRWTPQPLEEGKKASLVNADHMPHTDQFTRGYVNRELKDFPYSAMPTFHMKQRRLRSIQVISYTHAPEAPVSPRKGCLSPRKFERSTYDEAVMAVVICLCSTISAHLIVGDLIQLDQTRWVQGLAKSAAVCLAVYTTVRLGLPQLAYNVMKLPFRLYGIWAGRRAGDGVQKEVFHPETVLTTAGPGEASAAGDELTDAGFMSGSGVMSDAGCSARVSSNTNAGTRRSAHWSTVDFRYDAGPSPAECRQGLLTESTKAFYAYRTLDGSPLGTNDPIVFTNSLTDSQENTVVDRQIYFKRTAGGVPLESSRTSRSRPESEHEIPLEGTISSSLPCRVEGRIRVTETPQV
ncbi:hypothetical protein GNI_091950 [Gregarina niphandrodes]|uniref:Uncharacterized protein n=1 Tax=Gregarina niphandrodes TaxID=110365 RepID=A0A023B5D2_GRENI|nr:hypothetical protein GNI_091950 [Gregarina niphandrodes]EZG59684.1 hypothetical protein GNI_091950 [Gregarina niphandrodes]|eukprot:XP_011130883.1 hypothetical protein GNI_091950 [Gregarina niphandrodes]